MAKDAWKLLTSTALRLLKEADGKGRTEVDVIVDATLAEHPDILDIERFRASLEAFVRDVTDSGPPPPRAA